MRFSAPITLSPPVRKRTPRRESETSNVFRAPLSDDSSSDYESSSSSGSSVDSSSEDGVEDSDEEDSSEWDERGSEASRSAGEDGPSGSDSDVAYPLVPRKPNEKNPDQRVRDEVEDVLASIRLRSRYRDPYEEWEKQTRKDAFLTARKHRASISHDFQGQQSTNRRLENERLATSRAQELGRVEKVVSGIFGELKQEEGRLRVMWKERDQKLWERVERVIQDEEERAVARLEAEKRAREEEERRKREEEERRREEQERKKREEEDRRRKVEEENKRKQEEERERVEREAAERAKSEKEKDAKELRTTAGMMRPEDLWMSGMRTLRELKNGPMRAVKGPKPPDPLPASYQPPPTPPLKKLWSAQRRKITPKVGQLTDNPQEIARISNELKAIVAPVQGTPKALHYALLSSLAKIIIRQAETEITAHKEQAGPLAQVAVNLISAYPDLADIFWAKLCELVGCWIAPLEPSSDLDVVDGTTKLSEKQMAKVWSVREDEAQDSQTIRITGVLRLYCQMLFIPVTQPLPPLFRPARFWAYVTQLLSNPGLLKRPVAPEAIYVALDVGGIQAKGIWGKQWIKLLAFIYESVQGEGKERIGGSDAAAQASRVRCQMDIEKIMAEP